MSPDCSKLATATIELDVSDAYDSILLYTVTDETPGGSTITSIHDMSCRWQRGLSVGATELAPSPWDAALPKKGHEEDEHIHPPRARHLRQQPAIAA